MILRKGISVVAEAIDKYPKLHFCKGIITLQRNVGVLAKQKDEVQEQRNEQLLQEIEDLKQELTQSRTQIAENYARYNTIKQEQEKNSNLLRTKDEQIELHQNKLTEIERNPLDILDPRTCGSTAEIDLLYHKLMAKLEITVEHAKVLLHRQVDEYKNSVFCPICLERRKNIICIPCGHTLCSSCSETVFALNQKKCPVCRVDVQGTNVIYL